MALRHHFPDNACIVMFARAFAEYAPELMHVTVGRMIF